MDYLDTLMNLTTAERQRTAAIKAGDTVTVRELAAVNRRILDGLKAELGSLPPATS